jgi:hypothetical protein
MTADSEPIPTGRQIGFMPRTIDAPGYYWAKSYDKPPAASLYPEEGAGLTGLSVSGGTLDQNFSPYVSLYKVNVDHSVYGITVTPAAAAPDASVTVNGAPVASGSASPIIPLSLGRNTVKVEVTERSGTAAVYAIAVFRAGDPGNVFPITEASYVHEKLPTDRFGSASLLEVIDIPGASGGGDRIAFMKADFGSFPDTDVEEAKLYFYMDENVPKSVTLSVDGYAHGVWSDATIDWNNRPKGGFVPLGTVTVTSAGWYAVDVTGFINSRMEGDRTATFRIMDPGTKNTLVRIRGRSYEQFQPYLIVNPSRSAELSGLAISGASLSPAFSADVTEYRTDVTNSVYTVRLTPAAADKYVRIAVNGAAVPSGRPSADVPLQVGDNPIAINVTAQNGQSKTYNVTVTRAANSSLSSLTLSEGRLAPAFSPERTTYTVDLFAGVPKIKITPVTADEAAAVTVNGEPVARGQASGEIKLKIGGNTVTTVVTATDGTTTAYTLQVNRIPPGQQNREEP